MNAAHVSLLAALLERDPDARGIALRLVDLEKRRCGIQGCTNYESGHLSSSHHGAGFTWDQVGYPGHLIARYATTRLIEVCYRSRSRTEYRLVDVASTIDALFITSPNDRPATGPGLPTIPPDLFRGVIGLEQERDELRACLEASPPVSVLLSGPPASAKTVLVAEIARLAGATTIHGGAITSAGLTQLLLDPNPPRFLIVDEADKGRPVVLNRLLSVIETGLVTDLRYGGHREARLVLTVVMVANDPRKLDPALRSRLWPITLSAYADEATRRTVIAGFLVQREGVEPELAQEIATLVAPHTSDVRRARDVARLCQGDRRRAAHFAARLAT